LEQLCQPAADEREERRSFMKKGIITILLLIIAFSYTASVFAKSKTYIYRKRAEWVKLVTLSNKQLAGQVLAHPDTEISSEKMTSLLTNLTMNKAQLFKKGIKTSEIFTLEEAQRFAPLIVKALKQAQQNQVVNVSIVHKRPLYILRNDHLSLINIYVKEDGVHFYFAKVFAKLNGDYEQATRIYEAIRKAKSIRVSLATIPGQIISSDGKEITMDPTQEYSIPSSVVSTAKASPADAANNIESVAQKELSVDDEPLLPKTDIKTRLERLEELKKAGLITNKEYKNKRKELLKEI